MSVQQNFQAKFSLISVFPGDTTILSGESLHCKYVTFTLTLSKRIYNSRTKNAKSFSFIASRETDNDASIDIGPPACESSRVLDDTMATIPLQWERYSHKVLLAQHSSRFRDLLVRVWLELETQPLTNQAVIEDDFFFAS